MDFHIAIMSDLHVGGDAASTGGWMHAADNRSSTGQDLFGGLRKVIRSTKTRADLLVCPGDLTDQAHPAGLIRAWAFVQEIRNELEAQLTLGATGNHDTDSHAHFTPGEPWKTLRQLYPPFPIANDESADANNHYWAHGWCLIRHGTLRILCVNSSKQHTDPALAERGHVTLSDIADIGEALDNDDPSQYNLLLTHHHPMKLGALDPGDDSHMEHGEALLERLLTTDGGPWFAIHGHKHVPRVDYFSRGTAVMPIVAAGSLSAHLWDEAATQATNQFYLVKVTIDSKLPEIDTLSATCRAWSWAPSAGWTESGKSGGVMSGSGFGWRRPIPICADALQEALHASGQAWLERAELVAREPRYQNLTTDDQLSVHSELEARGFVVVNDDGRLKEFGSRA